MVANKLVFLSVALHLPVEYRLPILRTPKQEYFNQLPVKVKRVSTPYFNFNDAS